MTREQAVIVAVLVVSAALVSFAIGAWYERGRSKQDIEALERDLAEVGKKPLTPGRPRSAPDLVLRERIYRHLEWCGKELSAFELARALSVPWPNANGRDRVQRELAGLEDQGAIVAIEGPQYGDNGRAVTRWRKA